MNQDTLWLQVPAAKVPPLKLIGLRTTPDKIEHIAIRLSALQGCDSPYLDKINIILFTADHGILIENKNSLAQPITTTILNRLFSSNNSHKALLKKSNAKIEVINLGTKINLNPINGIINSKINSSTANFCYVPAMKNEQLAKAINIGRQSAQRMKLRGSQLFIASEISDANTLSALAMTCVLLNVSIKQINKIDTETNKLIQQALTKHQTELTSPLAILLHLGSFEIAALTGSYLCCAHMGMPVLIDGLASAVAALITARICPKAEQWFLYSHASNNTAHKMILETLKALPIRHIDKQVDNLTNIAITLLLLHSAGTKQNKIKCLSDEVLLNMTF